MNFPGDDVALALARLRQAGWLPVGDLPFARAEEQAAKAGRQVFLAAGDDGTRALAVLAWQGTEPAGSESRPRLLRRALSGRDTKTLVVAHALLTDPEASWAVVTQGQVLAAIRLLTSKDGDTWAVPALRQVLPRAGLLTHRDGGWAPGPVMLAWDLPTRGVMAQAARRLWEHPMWPGTRHG
ncbi:MAG: hypothetical protein ACRDOI_10040 [Trebonia sp.]